MQFALRRRKDVVRQDVRYGRIRNVPLDNGIKSDSTTLPKKIKKTALKVNKRIESHRIYY